MRRIDPYLNFPGTTEEAFNFYKTVFGGEFEGSIMRFKDVADLPNKDQMSEDELNKIMHISLKFGEHRLMATDAIPSFGQTITPGNNMSICLQPDSRDEADRIFAALSEGGEIEMPPTDMFWGGYFASWRDKYGIQWMFEFSEQPA